MKSNEQYTAKRKEGKKSTARLYPAQSRRPEMPVPVFHGTIRYQEAEEEE